MKRPVPLAVGLALLGCGNQPTVVPVRNLERPSDMSFVCVRVADTGNGPLLTGRPMADCHPHLDSQFKPQPASEAISFSPRAMGTFGLVTNTARGELAVVDMDRGALVDLDRSQPGFNMLPVGEFPEVMAASQDGCMVAAASRGTCDLAVIDPQRLLVGSFGGVVSSTGMGPLATRVTPTTASGRKLQVAPQEIAFLPQAPATLDLASEKPLKAESDASPATPTDGGVSDTTIDPSALCQTDGAYNKTTPGKRAPWRAVVTFPSCELVAVVELPSGLIVSSVYVRSTGVVDAGTEPVCPTDCGLGVVPRPAPDAAPAPVSHDAAVDAAVTVAADAAAAPDAAADSAASDAAAVGAGPDTVSRDAGPSGPFPTDVGPPRVPGAGTATGALVIRPEGNRLYVGGGNDQYVTALDIVDGKLQPADGGGRLPLHEGAGGVRRLRLSLDPFTIFGTTERKIGKFMGGDIEAKQYLYAFALDDSVRVLDVNPVSTRTFERECDVNIDPQFIPTDDPQYVGGVPDCYGLLDDPAHPPARRRAPAKGPGLRIPNIGNAEQAPPAPLDIAFSSQRDGTASISGDFGFLVASDGNVYVINVDSLLTGVNPADNTYRDFNAGLSPLAVPGGPQVLATPARNFGLTDIPLPVQVPLGNLQGPRIEGMVNDSTREIKWAAFPDLYAVNSQSWFTTWEGGLTTSTRTHGGVLPAGTMSPLTKDMTGPAGSVFDEGQEFCQQGVLPKDVVLLTGCSQDSDCSTDGTSVCRQALPGTPGLCFPNTQAKDPAVLAQCTRLLGSRRRYEVVAASPNQIDLALKPDELPKTGLNPCMTKADCQSPIPGGVVSTYDGFDCVQLRPDEPKRCVKPCATSGAKDDQKCRAGTVCEQIPGTLLTDPICVEGPPITKDFVPGCWPLGTGFEVQLGQSFLVNGSLAPRPATVRLEPPAAGSAGHCVLDTTRHPLLVNRIPLDAPHCANVPDEDDNNIDNTRNAFASTIPTGPPGTWGNPCLFWGVNDDDECARVPGPDPKMPYVLPSNMGCTCNKDPMGNRGSGCHVKALFQNQQVRFIVTNLEQFAGDANISRFDVTGGYRPETVSTRDDIIVTIGVRIVTGPLETPESANRFPIFYPYLYLVDQGRTGSSAAARGQVLRINPRYSTYGVPQFDSNYSPYPFQIQ
jgi:hypothetical protein